MDLLSYLVKKHRDREVRENHPRGMKGGKKQRRFLLKGTIKSRELAGDGESLAKTAAPWIMAPGRACHGNWFRPGIFPRFVFTSSCFLQEVPQDEEAKGGVIQAGQQCLQNSTAATSSQHQELRQPVSDEPRKSRKSALRPAERL